MNAGLDHKRTSYALELRTLDLSLSVLLFAQNRFGFDMQPASSSYRSQSVQVLVTNQSGHAVHELVASATYDGYFSLSVPLSPNFDVGVLFGKQYSWLQIDSVERISDGDYAHPAAMAPGSALFDQMAHQQDGLYQVDAGGMLYLPAVAAATVGTQLCRVIFRPLARVDP